MMGVQVVTFPAPRPLTPEIPGIPDASGAASGHCVCDHPPTTFQQGVEPVVEHPGTTRGPPGDHPGTTRGPPGDHPGTTRPHLRVGNRRRVVGTLVVLIETFQHRPQRLLDQCTLIGRRVDTRRPSAIAPAGHPNARRWRILCIVRFFFGELAHRGYRFSTCRVYTLRW